MRSIFKRANRGTEWRWKSRREKGVSLFLGIAALSFIVMPMAGLTIDVAFLYSSKARLQAAVDGASLAAARALIQNTELPAREIAEKSLRIAGQICIYTNDQITIEELHG